MCNSERQRSLLLEIYTMPATTWRFWWVDPQAENGAFDVVPAKNPANLSFLAKPSRLSVSLHDGISGAVCVFDPYQNLITVPTPVSFELSGVSAAAQTRTVATRNGCAWTEMDSAAKEGAAQFVARVGGISSTRVIQQVPGRSVRIENERSAVRRRKLSWKQNRSATAAVTPCRTERSSLSLNSMTAVRRR